MNRRNGKLTPGSLIPTLVVVWAVSCEGPAVKPNFSGTWKLNTQRSGPILPHGLTGLLLVIDHTDPAIVRIKRKVMEGKPSVSSVFGGDPDVPIDGKEHVIRSGGGDSVSVRSRWAGESVLRYQVLMIRGVRYTSDTRTTLSAGCKVLTIAENYREPGLERMRDWVFERQ